MLLSQAIKVIQAHWEATYPQDLETSTIQIYLSCCLETSDIDDYYNERDHFANTSKEEIKKELAELDIIDELPPRDEEQMENYYKIEEGYYSLDIDSLINNSLYTTRLEDFDSSKTSEEEEEGGFSYSYFYLKKQIILIVSKKDTLKYKTQTSEHFELMIYKAITNLHTYLRSLNIDFAELSNKIKIDLRGVRGDNPTWKKIYAKLLEFAIKSNLNSRMEYFYTLGAKNCNIVVYLLHDTGIILKDGNYSYTEEVVVGDQVDRVANHKINEQNIFTILNTYTINLKESDLNLGNDELYDKMIAQVVEAAAREAAAKAREAEEALAREAAAREAKAREAEAAEVAALRRRNLQRLVREESAIVEAEAIEEADAREAAAREAAASSATASSAAKAKNYTRRRFFTHRTKIYPVIGGIKTKFKRKRRRKISTNRIFPR